MTKMVTIYKVKIVDDQIPLKDFLESRDVYFEYIDKDIDTCYIPDPYYPNESFILICQEVDSGEISLHEIGYVLCTDNSLFLDDELKKYVIEHIDEFVSLEL